MEFISITNIGATTAAPATTAGPIKTHQPVTGKCTISNAGDISEACPVLYLHHSGRCADVKSNER